MSCSEAVVNYQYKVNQAEWQWLAGAEILVCALANWETNGMQDFDRNIQWRHAEQKGSFRDLLSIATGEAIGSELVVTDSLHGGSPLMPISQQMWSRGTAIGMHYLASLELFIMLLWNQYVWKKPGTVIKC